MAMWGTSDSHVNRPNWLEVGQIKKLNVSTLGSGYGSAPSVAIAAPASGTQATGTAVLSGSTLASITITDPGDGYVAGDAAGVTIAAPTTNTVATSAVTTATDTFTTGTHNLNTGDAVIYANGGGTDATGLTGGTTYFAIKVDATNIKVATNKTLAEAGTAITITGTGNNAQSFSGVQAVASVVKAANKYAAADIMFVDTDEAALAQNKARGITGAGWWTLKSGKQDSDGNTRYQAECIVAMSRTAAQAGDDAADDAMVSDAANSFAITVQPAAATTSSGAATYTLTTGSVVGTIGALNYKWQRQTATGTRWTDISASLDGSIYSDFTTATLAVAGVTDTTHNGKKYRVKVNSANGAPEQVSNGVATLTFGT